MFTERVKDVKGFRFSVNFSFVLRNHNTDLLTQVICHARDNAFGGNVVILLENVRKKRQAVGMWMITLFSFITNVVSFVCLLKQIKYK